ncbi:phosphoglycerate kinase [Bacteroidia bacterium]|nr:phosphoglycerate kinase [Bacteroidia bacterium]|tara:strand:+ start:1590 stop:2777 length:1188 start_codon:yes stop_codon:yes gene_type:complete
MKTVDSYDFEGKRALVRVDFNVPLNDALEITDDSRITTALPTIKKILSDGGSVVLMSHLGRPKNGPENKYSLKHLISHLEKLTGAYIEFSNDCISSNAIQKSKNLAPNTIHLLENLRFHYQETEGDKSFAKKLAQHGDVYVNDAFGSAHRAHASTAIVAQYFDDKYFGYLMANEVANAKKLMSNPERPFTAIVGGAKVSDKILIIENLLNIADHIIIGGGMAYTFSVARGGTIGDSLFEADRVEKCAEILAKATEKGVHIHLPADNICADAFSNEANQQAYDSGEIPDGWMGLDIGEKAIADFSDVLLKSKTILWNGPMGVFEMPSYENGTKAIAQAVADATKAGAFSLIGGGDSSAAVKKFGFTDDVSYVSTGGGALLEFFEGKELPGIAAVEG